MRGIGPTGFAQIAVAAAYRSSPGLEVRPGSCPSSVRSVLSIRSIIVAPQFCLLELRCLRRGRPRLLDVSRDSIGCMEDVRGVKSRCRADPDQDNRAPGEPTKFFNNRKLSARQSRTGYALPATALFPAQQKRLRP